MDAASFEGLVTGDALRALAPLLAVSLGVMVALLAELVPALARARAFVFPGTLVVALIAGLALLSDPVAEPVFAGSYLGDAASAAWGLSFVAAGALAWAFGRRYYREEAPFLAEHDVLILCSVAGMMLMAGAQDLLTFFVGLELLSVPLYALAAFRRAREASVEAGLKYFMLGAFSAGLFLYGAALLYAASGTITLAELPARVSGSTMGLAGVGLVAASLLFKASVFPFHFWAPDVYQGSPTPVTAFMATGTKAAAFAFLLNLAPTFPRASAGTIAALAIATMAVGNLAALVQTDLKRMLAYSSVAHAGTLLLLVPAVVVGGEALSEDAVRAAIYYAVAYVFTAGGAFGLIAWLESDGERFTRLDALRGLAKRRPAMAAAMALFMLSLGGIPLTGGFLGKYLVFAALVRAELFVVAIPAVLLSVVALGYYLRVVVALYMQPEPEGQEPPSAKILSASIGAGACAAMVVLLGILPQLLLGPLKD